MTQQLIRFVVGIGVLSAVGIGASLRYASQPTIPTPEKQTLEAAATPTNMVYVPGGFAIVGNPTEDGDADHKQRRVFIPSFYMDRTEVTNREYKGFQPSHTYPNGEDSLPVTNVTYDDAEAYAHWAGKRLPTEIEWEKAARGTDGRTYPWGNNWDKNRVAARAQTKGMISFPLAATKMEGQCLLGPSRVRPVGSVPAGASPYGALDMAGNAWEWVQGNYLGNPEQRILRGGAVGYGERACRTYERGIEGAKAT